MQVQSRFSAASLPGTINPSKTKAVEPETVPSESFESSSFESVKECAAKLYEKAPIAGNIVLASGIGLTSALVAAGTAMVMPAALTLATTVMALTGGTFACYATLDNSDTIDQAVRTFVGGVVASVAGPAAAAEGLAAGLIFGSVGAAMMTKEK